jgi:hypothetical protein
MSIISDKRRLSGFASASAGECRESSNKLLQTKYGRRGADTHPSTASLDLSVGSSKSKGAPRPLLLITGRGRRTTSSRTRLAAAVPRLHCTSGGKPDRRMALMPAWRRSLRHRHFPPSVGWRALPRLCVPRCWRWAIAWIVYDRRAD